MSVRRIVTGALAALGLVAGIAATAGPAAASTRAVVVPVNCGSSGLQQCGSYKASYLRLTVGPEIYATHVKWSSWGNNEATGNGYLYGADIGVTYLGHVTLHFYAPESASHSVLYFSKLHVTGGHGVAAWFTWSWSSHGWSGD
jgi:hypothetical protein